jgi:hypothetical protein
MPKNLRITLSPPRHMVARVRLETSRLIGGYSTASRLLRGPRQDVSVLLRSMTLWVRALSFESPYAADRSLQ